MKKDNLTQADIFGKLAIDYTATRCCCLAVLAHLVEHLTCNHEVSGSIPEDGFKKSLPYDYNYTPLPLFIFFTCRLVLLLLLLILKG